MIIKSKIKDYRVIVEENDSFIRNITGISNSLFVIDENVYNLYRYYFQEISKDKLVIIEATEDNKIIDKALEICEKITDIQGKRNVTLVSFGGGIIQDITGFVSSIMYRGIHWIFVPTTLLSACDSCIGSKTSLNYKKYKNLLGTFYPPDEIHIYPCFFDTLSDKDYYSGLGEVIKFNIMEGISGLSRIEENIDLLLKRDFKTINKFILYSLNYKKKYIEIDEFDLGERIKLNFAHTFGHAIEVISDYYIPHGTAVAIGMIMADRVSYMRGYISEEILKRSENVLLKVIDIDVDVLNKEIKNYVEIMKKDKKQLDSSLTTVLLSKYDEKSELSLIRDTSISEIEDAVLHFIYIYRLFCTLGR